MSSMTLSIDCGGLFIKSCVLDESGTMHAAPTRVETPYLRFAAPPQTDAAVVEYLPAAINSADFGGHHH